jgi:ATP-dependent Clp protease protease subunit
VPREEHAATPRSPRATLTPTGEKTICVNAIVAEGNGGGVGGQASDIELQAKEILRMRDLLNGMISTDTGQTADRVASDTDRDFIMTAVEAVEYGVVDEVITSRETPLGAIGAA